MSIVKAFTPAIFATAAFICGTAANIYCETFQFPQVTNAGDATLFVGLWSYRSKNVVQTAEYTWVISTCRNYDSEGFDYSLDSRARTAMAFSILAPVIGGIALIWSCFLPCRGTVPDSAWKCLGSTFMFTAILQGLTLIAQSSSLCNDNPVLQYLEAENTAIRESFPDTCEWAAGFKMNIAAVALWFLAGLAPFVIKAPEVSAREPVQSQTVTYQQNPDGTVQETNVVVVKGTDIPSDDIVPPASAEATIEEPMK